MKKNVGRLLLITICVALFAGCSLNLDEKVSNSSMIRTLGLNETAMPIEKGSYAIEYFNNEATSIDVITETYTSNDDWFSSGDIHLSGGKLSRDLRYYGINGRFSIDNYTELKFGMFKGKIEDGHENYTYLNEDGFYISNNTEFYTNIYGTQLGIKRLLTDYSSPHRLSAYLEGQYFSTSSASSVEQFDGDVLALKSALIYGYLVDPAHRNFPSLSLYYSLTNTKRAETILGVPLKNQPQAVGLEANYNVDMKLLYLIASIGAEKDIADKVSDDINTYFGVKLGIHINKMK